MPRVSVIIPSYNHEKFVAAAIQSVLEQTYQDFEIIITDDGSTDETVSVIKSFTDPRIKLFYFDCNQGACAAANNCISAATGEFIAMLSSDDVFARDKLEKQVSFLDLNPKIGAVLSYAEIIDDSGELLSEDHFYKHIFIQPNKTRFEWLNYFFFGGNCLCHPSALIRKECYDNVGLYDERFAQLPDFDFWIRLCIKYEIYIIPENLISFRVHKHEMNTSGNKPESHIRHALEAAQILKNYLCEEVYCDFAKIFLSIIDEISKNDKKLIPAFIAILALQINRPENQYFGIDTLYQIFKDKDVVRQLREKDINFSDLVGLSKSLDVFGLFSLNFPRVARSERQLWLLQEKLKKIQSKFQQFHQVKSQSYSYIEKQPLVSLCIPTYNGEEFITEAILSVLQQTYSSVEIIISDDNSTDGTVELVKSIQNNDSLVNIRIFQHQRYGLAGNWNFCISQAKGKYIKFLMQDDLLEPECIEEMVNLAEQDDEVGLVFSPRDIIMSKSAESDPASQFVYEGCKDLHKAWSKLKSIQSSQELLADPNFLDESPLNKIGEPTTVLIKKDVFERLGNFDPQLQQLIDLDMWFRIIGNYKTGFINKTLSYFRIHPRQASRTNFTNGESSKDSQRFYTKMLSSLEYSFLSAAHKHLISTRLAHMQNWQLLLQQPTEENFCSVTYPVIDPVGQKTDRSLLWSVMIPTYNPNLSYLEKTLKSILEQAFGVDQMQIEVVDDRSTQNDLEELVQRIGQGRVSFYRQPKNLGLIGNWNACIERARGHWVHILHQDDLVKPGFYNRLQTAFEIEPTIGAAFCRYFYMDEKGYEQALSPLERETPGVIPNWIERIAVSQRIECPSIVVKREVYEKLGGFCPEAHYAADWEMWKRIAAYYSVWYEPELLASYRSHSLSETSRLIESGANIADTRKAIEISQSYLPVTIAAELSHQARENCAFKALNVARQMLSKGNIDTAIAQIQEGIKSSQSSNTITSMLELVQEVVRNSHQHNLLPLDALNLFLPAFQEPLQEQQALALVDSLNLKDNSLVIFPNWNLSEDLIYEDLANVISHLMNHPDRDRTTLLMDRGNLTEEEATLFISGVVMNLVMETDLDVADELEIASIGQLSEMQWEVLLPRINARIVLEHENEQAIVLSKIESIPTYEVSSLSKVTNILT